MLTMAKIHYIREACDLKDENYSKIARDLGIDRRTVKKYAEMENLSPTIKSYKRKSPVMDPVKPIIIEILKSDKKMPKKQRHTAKRIFERLKNECDFNGSYSSVKTFVRKVKKKIYNKNKAAVPLKHLGGEAQCDFGQALVIHDGIEKTGHYLILSFPFSNAAFVQLFWGENQECFIQGMINIFNEIGAVPMKIWFDNLTPAVSKIYPQGKRKFTDAFKRFATHYRFKPVFCNPNKGNEKGHVESKVGYIRRNFFVPIPRFRDLHCFNEKLLIKSRDNMDRKHYLKKDKIKDLFKLESSKFMQLPSQEYDNYKLKEVKTNKFGFIKFDKTTYSTSPTVADQNVWLKIKFNSIEVLNDSYEKIVLHKRSYDKDDQVMNWLPYIDELIKKPRAMQYTEFYHKLPEAWKIYLTNAEDVTQGLNELKEILNNNNLSDKSDQIMEMKYLYKYLDGTQPALPELSDDTNLKMYDPLLGNTGVDHYGF